MESSSPRVKPSRTGVNRRDLLRLQRLGAGGSASTNLGAVTRSHFDLVRAHRPAMGSYFEVRLPAGAPGALDLACRALDVIDGLEAQLTVYREDSEVSRLNATAHLGPVEI